MGIASGYFAKNLWFLVNFRLKISRTPFFCTTFVLSLHETSKMLRIKKLDIFVLKSFCMLFMGTFFICLFIFMMQFLWRYVDEMVGKGLEMTVLAQFFFYSALSLVPASLPLAILLAALITFGNFGERFELLAMKAAGISLLKIMRPLIIFICFMSVDSSAYYNPGADPVDMSEMIDMEDSSVLLMQKKEIEKNISTLTDVAVPYGNAVEIREPDDDAMERIRGLLNMKTKRVSVERPVFVPAILDTIQGELSNYVSDIGFIISEIINIQYGKKIRAKLGFKTAEINLFYGKRGFSVVVSPKTGTDGTLNVLLADTVRAFIDER